MKSWRTILILFLVILFGAGIVTRLFYIQILQHKLYESQALGQQSGFQKITGERGQILCDNSQQSKGEKSAGQVKSLAINKDQWILSVEPSKITDKNLFAKSLAKNIGQTETEILSKLNAQEVYVVLARDVQLEQLEKIKALGLLGLTWQADPKRFYPQGSLAPQVVGFLGGEQTGQYGIEGYYEDILKGKSDIQEQKRGLGSVFSSETELSLDGSDIYLTIDYNIQFQAEELLKKARQNLNIDSGQIIVMKPDTGKILALANYPLFDPNNYGKETNFNVFQNAVVQKLFEPGSIMKPFTMAMALNEGKITPDTRYTDKGFLKIGVETIHNFNNKVYGERTMTEVLENSINTGAVFAQEQISHKIFLDYLEKFGFLDKTGVDLQGEVRSKNELLKKGQDIEFATASFGQGIELTPLQVVTGYCALANGGKIVTPYIVEKIVSNGDEEQTKVKVSDKIFSDQTHSQLTKMLINVLENGYDKIGKIPGYYLAGKTGTAQVPLENGKGYYTDKTIQSFVGFGPANNPEFVIMVKLDNPKVASSALSAVPLFKELAQYMINYWQIPPDYDINAEKK